MTTSLFRISFVIISYYFIAFCCIFFYLRRDFDRSQFALVQFGSEPYSDFDSSGSVNRKRVYGSVCDQSESSSSAGSVWFNMADVYMPK